MLHQLIMALFDALDIYQRIDISDDLEQVLREYILGKLDDSEEHVTSADYENLVLYYEDKELKAFCMPTIEYYDETCGSCGGSGEIDGEECPSCDGSGQCESGEELKSGMSGKMWVKLNQNTLEPIDIEINWKNSW